MNVRERLEELIVSGAFAHGERLDEVRLAERFDVSRTPVREAFQHLAASGLIEQRPRRGAFVRYPDAVELMEMFEVMAELEALCGARAARHATPMQVEAIAAAAEACEGAVDADAYYRLNERFHHAIYEASNNGFLAAEAARLHRRLRPFRRMQLQLGGRVRQSQQEHRAIVAALQSADPHATAEALRVHVAIQGERFTSLAAQLRAERGA